MNLENYFDFYQLKEYSQINDMKNLKLRVKIHTKIGVKHLFQKYIFLKFLLNVKCAHLDKCFKLKKTC